MSACPFPRPQGPGTLGAGLGVSTEWVLALWLTLREGRAGAREEKVHGGKGAGWGPGAAVFILSRPCFNRATGNNSNKLCKKFKEVRKAFSKV